jgi:hypothetical protein
MNSWQKKSCMHDVQLKVALPAMMHAGLCECMYARSFNLDILLFITSLSSSLQRLGPIQRGVSSPAFIAVVKVIVQFPTLAREPR